MGQVLAGRFELVDVLDSGGAGTIWRVWDHQHGCYLAAKILRQTDDDAVIRFVQESTRIVDDPHITVPRNRVAIDDTILFTMDLIAGGSVASLLRDFGPLPEGWITELARQAADALAAVHAAGFAHRDIKPANLLLEATGRNRPHLRLSDFGSAGRFDGPRLTMPAAVVGTPGYLSPEAAHGAGPAPAQDIYALGATLHELATGTPPDQPPPTSAHASPRVTVELNTLIAEMTAHNPADRPQSADDVTDLIATLPGADDLAFHADASNPIEIYHQLPPLPAGWTITGPIEQRGAPELRRGRSTQSPTGRDDLRARDTVAAAASLRPQSRSTGALTWLAIMTRAPNAPAAALAVAGFTLIVLAVLLA